ncbi:LysR family transcriptional regulator [Nocardioides sp. AE5]|uniref:LysR family transcriptional regulator n=1 Tax=Nocardioides sp. AE5 TaxID=2962573 RepID=UPI0028823ED9|nr:LysR family transcriptional regulator [Nocardioides sp. AE5]MDT0203380.1 LysR family transcriptional regulator [Nocardioides sp. AE5]
MTQKSLDLETLRLLVAVDHRGSIGAAAHDLGLSQPAASKRIREFEARWRLRVIERSPRGSRFTDDGRAVLAWAAGVIHESDLMLASLAALAERRRDTLAVAASLTVAEFMLPRWIGELRTAHPELHPHLQVVNSAQVADLVRAGQVDVGFIETAEFPRDLAVTPVGSDALGIVVVPGHAWARRSVPLTREQILAEEFVLREEGSGTRSTFERALRARAGVALEAGSTAAMLGAVLAGAGPAVVSRRAVTAYVETGRLVEVRHGLDLRRPISAVSPPGRRFDDRAEELVRIARLAARRDAGDPDGPTLSG